jgi:hypothetical protein
MAPSKLPSFSFLRAPSRSLSAQSSRKIDLPRSTSRSQITPAVNHHHPNQSTRTESKSQSTLTCDNSAVDAGKRRPHEIFGRGPKNLARAAGPGPTVSPPAAGGVGIYLGGETTNTRTRTTTLFPPRRPSKTPAKMRAAAARLKEPLIPRCVNASGPTESIQSTAINGPPSLTLADTISGDCVWFVPPLP